MQGIHDQAANDRMIGVDRITNPCIIRVVGLALRVQQVIGAVLESAETQYRSAVIPLSGMVENHIENDLDTGPVQRLDHVLELFHRPEGLF